MVLNKIKITALRIIFISLLLITLISFISCKEEPEVVEEEEQEEEKQEESAETKTNETEGKSSEIAEETLPTTEEPEEPKIESTGIIEDEGLNLPTFEGLRYEAETNTYFAEAGNPYGLEVDTEAGVFIKDAFEFNGVVENSIGLRPEIIDYWQKKIVKEDHKLLFPIPLDLRKVKVIKIDLLEDEYLKKFPEVTEKTIDKITYLGIRFTDFNQDIFIYAPVSTFIEEIYGQNYGGFMYGPNFLDDENPTSFDFDFNIPMELSKDTLWKGNRVDSNTSLSLMLSEGELLVDNPLVSNEQSKNYSAVGDLGLIIAKINSSPDPRIERVIGNNSFRIQYHFVQMEQDSSGKTVIPHSQYTGDEILMELNDLKVSIMPANE